MNQAGGRPEARQAWRIGEEENLVWPRCGGKRRRRKLRPLGWVRVGVNQAGVWAACLKGSRSQRSLPSKLKKVTVYVKEKHENYLGVQK